ncbi:hypothetical protein AAEX28_04410 [Lentisphaerota bacterium WC36G]|nr:hypothetical protein LJT99_07275 [Lentisphaerae bacterium WC36]
MAGEIDNQYENSEVTCPTCSKDFFAVAEDLENIPKPPTQKIVKNNVQKTSIKKVSKKSNKKIISNQNNKTKKKLFNEDILKVSIFNSKKPILETMAVILVVLQTLGAILFSLYIFLEIIIAKPIYVQKTVFLSASAIRGELVKQWLTIIFSSIIFVFIMLGLKQLFRYIRFTYKNSQDLVNLNKSILAELKKNNGK